MLGYYSIWPFFACLIAIVILMRLPVMRFADTPPKDRPGRLSSLDGLRGFLALSVFFHHASIFHGFLISGVWALPPSRFFSNLGPAGVGLFFMITGSLFWRKVSRENSAEHWLRLYVGRVFRIMPLYAASVAGLLLGVAIATTFSLRQPLLTVTVEVMKWAAGGVFAPVPINAYADTGRLTAGVTWTLRYEWLFYAALWPLSIISRNKTLRLALPAGILVFTLCAVSVLGDDTVTASPLEILALFCCGLVTEAAVSAVGRTHRGPVNSLFVSILVLTGLFASQSSNSPVAIIALGLAFYFILGGTSLFNLLTSRAAARLGNISFGIYLFQGQVLSGVFASPSARRLALSSPAGHWALVLTAAVILVALATLLHIGVERPGIALGSKVVRKLIRLRPFSPRALEGIATSPGFDPVEDRLERAAAGPDLVGQGGEAVGIPS